MFAARIEQVVVDKFLMDQANIKYCGIVHRSRLTGNTENFKDRICVVLPGYLTFVNVKNAHSPKTIIREAIDNLNQRLTQPYVAEGELQGIDLDPNSLTTIENDILTITTNENGLRPFKKLSIKIERKDKSASKSELQTLHKVIKDIIDGSYLPNWNSLCAHFTTHIWNLFCSKLDLSPFWSPYFNNKLCDGGLMLDHCREAFLLIIQQRQGIALDNYTEAIYLSKFFDIISSHPILRVILIIFSFEQFNVTHHQRHVSSQYQKNENGKNTTKENAMLLVDLLLYVRGKVQLPTWSEQMRRLLHAISYPSTSSNNVHMAFSSEEITWYKNRLIGPYPYRNIPLSYIQLKLMVENTPYMDYHLTSFFAMSEQTGIYAREMYKKIPMDLLLSSIEVPITDKFAI